jgi:hypothetical protein
VPTVIESASACATVEVEHHAMSTNPASALRFLIGGRESTALAVLIVQPSRAGPLSRTGFIVSRGE